MRESGLELVEHRFAETCRHAAGNKLDHAAGSVARLADFQQVGDHLFGHLRIATVQVVGAVVCFHFLEGHRAVGDAPALDAVRFDNVRKHLDAFACEDLLGDGAAGDSPDRFSPGSSPGPAPVAVLAVLVEEVHLRMRRTDGLLHVAILVDVDILRVDVADKQADRRAGRDALEPAGDDFDAVGLLAGRVELALPGSALVQLVLDFIHVEFNSRRHAVDDAEKRPAVAALADLRVPAVRFTARRHLKYASDCVA